MKKLFPLRRLARAPLWLLTRRGLTVLLVLGFAVAGGVGWQKYWKAKKAQPPVEIKVQSIPSEKGVLSGEPQVLAPMTIGPDFTYQKLEDFTRRNYRSVLEYGRADWKPGDVELLPAGPSDAFRLDDMPAPDAAQIAEWKNRSTPVRPMPFPFSLSLAIPSDCCGSYVQDPYYMHEFLSRTYGLDFPGSFYPYTSLNLDGIRDGGGISVFSGDGREPIRYPVPVESDVIDAFPLFLTYYHRGWIDHIHGWASGAGPGYSLVKPALVTSPTSGASTQELETTPGTGSYWHGIQLDLEPDDRVRGFEIELIDQLGMRHLVVYGRKLGDRPGWDLSGRPRGELRKCSLLLNQERNRPARNGLGTAQSPALANVRVTIDGESGAQLKVNGLLLIDLTRELVRTQAEALSRLNVLPVVSTHHGGNTVWANALPIAGGHVFEDPFTKTKVVQDRPAAAADPQSPSYSTDILRPFGVMFYSRTGREAVPPVLEPQKFADQSGYYQTSRRRLHRTPNPRLPPSTGNSSLEELGSEIALSLLTNPSLGSHRAIYTHFNRYSPDWVRGTDGHTAAQLHRVKRLTPFTEGALQALANAKYDLDGKRTFGQRVWSVHYSVQLRFAQAARHLADHVNVKGNDVFITGWTDEVTGQQLPSAQFVSQDLHGQTVYVPDSQKARVFVDGKEVRSIKRNPPDFTGKPSVTIVDTAAPTVVFDEVDFLERSGRVFPHDACGYLQRRNAYSGEWSYEVQSEKDGAGWMEWKPYHLHNHETDYIRFAYKKTNPSARVLFGWAMEGDGPRFVATDGSLEGRQGWQLPHFADTEYHEVVLDYADMVGPKSGEKKIPRGPVRGVFFGLADGSKGDAVFFDRVEFLSARGVRPTRGTGLLIGGRIHPARDGERVTMKVAGNTREAVTERGGWYFFADVPRDAVAEIAFERAGVTYSPIRGRLMQADKNDLEYHIFALDPRSPTVPRPDFGGQTVPTECDHKCTGVATYPGPSGNFYAPHTLKTYSGLVGSPIMYCSEEMTNNFGFADRDRRVENPDRSLRIFLQGTCMEEGAQVVACERMNIVLESILRRKTGLNVEVIVASHSNASPAANAALYELYGRQFRPDVVVMMNDPVNMLHLEPSLIERLKGWAKGHNPYRTYDFDEAGRLVETPPDSGFAAHAGKPNLSPLVDDVPLTMSFFVAGEYPQLIRRAFQLFEAIAREKYVRDLSDRGGRLVVAAGYLGNQYPALSGAGGPKTKPVVPDRYWRELGHSTEAAGGTFLNIADPVLRNSYRDVITWGPADGHLTPAAHRIVAGALADRLLADPDFQAKVRQLRNEPGAK